MREIKVVEKNGKLAVRNIPDALARGEIIVAARWQDGEGVKAFAQSLHAQKELNNQLGYEPELNSSLDELCIYMMTKWDESTLRYAMSTDGVTSQSIRKSIDWINAAA
jgi:hypothetical protein